MSLRLIASILFFNVVPAAATEQPGALLQAGLYDITYSLELPHLENWAIDKTTTLCIRKAGQSAPVTLPVLSDNTPFADCVAKDIVFDGAKLSYDIVCAGRDSAKAHASYIVVPGAFRGRVAMVMGAKNMTMTETQVGRRRGSCDLATAPKADH